MRVRISMIAALLAGVSLADPVPSAPEAEPAPLRAPAESEGRLLSGVRRLTFAGRRAGEGYFSPDGSRLVFQSEREPANPFFQIYELSLETGDVRRVSSGAGKTTCAFIQPRTGDVLYASTHHDPRTAALQQAELDFRVSGQTRRYEWDFDPEMELYVSSAGALESRRLTLAPGYDAEGSYSPDGRWIVFASTRQAHARDLNEAERRQFEVDPSYFAEIYRMREDGSAVERLTTEPGYDGGPFFTPDGSRIVWRRFTPDGLRADVWSMRADGSDATRITDFGCMSWAPYTHPSGEYVFFTSNKLGFDNFELFLVDALGEKEPQRVTYTPGFDGLPVPSPSGDRLLWTSKRGGEGGAQLFLADWNHQAALEALRQAPPRGHAAPADAKERE